MKTDSTFKATFNSALDLVMTLPEGAGIPSESNLSSTLHVSRTTVRKVLKVFEEKGFIRQDGRVRLRSGNVIGDVRFPVDETIPISAQVETRFLQWMLRDDASPGTAINELDLARKFGVATNVVREFLNRFQRFGLIERRIGTGWVLKGFNAGFARELCEIREMFEMRSARAFAQLPEQSPLWGKLAELRARHVALLNDIEASFHDFSEIDSDFHRLIISVVPNRFIDGFYDIITMIFHYHYQWNKDDERLRNEAALHEHLAYIDALLAGDPDRIEAACAAHLTSARRTLMRSIRG
jgi:DNA-binding GntR family transcriptional regulator